jgi:chemotaxis response regulator CheB
MAQRVLIADDAAFMREMLRDILTDGGYEVVGEASDGNEAVSAFAKYLPDLLTLDIVMPRKKRARGAARDRRGAPGRVRGDVPSAQREGARIARRRRPARATSS